nr:MAG TPA: hypothetical protein [Caudoviricetes sp.]
MCNHRRAAALPNTLPPPGTISKQTNRQDKP